jgi:hypothetical protein
MGYRSEMHLREAVVEIWGKTAIYDQYDIRKGEA